MRKMVQVALTAALLFGSGALLLTCDLLGESDDKGGAGADFDASQYYTKAQVDAKFIAVSTALNNQIPACFNYSLDIPSFRYLEASGWENRGAGWQIPAGALFGLFEVWVQPPDSADVTNVTVHFAATEDSWAGMASFSVKSGENPLYTYIFPIAGGVLPSGTTHLYPYCSKPSSWPVGWRVRVNCIGWIGGPGHFAF